MTPAGEQLCYADAYRRTVDARVASVEAGDATLLVLDRTVFYPGGGGQPSDRGDRPAHLGRPLVDGPRRSQVRW